MMPATIRMPPFDADQELLRHGTALRSLALALLRDADRADDAVQDAMVAAIERPPRHADSPGGWLATVLRRVAMRGLRRERRQQARERSAAVGEAVDPAQQADREATLRAVVTAVTALDEPYRSAIWARYFEGLSPARIASRSGDPLATVKSRLQRGLQQLRLRLDRDPEIRDWRAAVAAAFGGRSVLMGAAGWMVMATMAKWVGAAALVAVAAFVCWPARVDAVP